MALLPLKPSPTLSNTMGYRSTNHRNSLGIPWCMFNWLRSWWVLNDGGTGTPMMERVEDLFVVEKPVGDTKERSGKPPSVPFTVARVHTSKNNKNSDLPPPQFCDGTRCWCRRFDAEDEDGTMENLILWWLLQRMYPHDYSTKTQW